MAGQLKTDIYEAEKLLTIENKRKLEENQNLLYWYEKLYSIQFQGIENIHESNILEIGSGTSPLKRFLPNTITSDILSLDYLDHRFDAHTIDRYAGIPDGSIDIITLTNVLHHLKNPLLFLSNARQKLKKGGRIIFTEPFFSHLASFVYTQLHHEPVDFEITRPELPEMKGPLSSANIALPYLIFYSQQNWERPLRDIYEFSVSRATYYTALSYMFTGGISRRIPVPGFLYRLLYRADYFLAQRFPKIFASFFILTLTTR